MFPQNPYQLLSSPNKVEISFENTLNNFLVPLIYDVYEAPPRPPTHKIPELEAIGLLNSFLLKVATDIMAPPLLTHIIPQVTHLQAPLKKIHYSLEGHSLPWMIKLSLL